MSIEINGNRVITDGLTGDPRVLQLLTGFYGKYSTLHPQVTSGYISGGTNLDAKSPVITITMTANDNIGWLNGVAGASSIVLLDRTSNGYIPTFNSYFKWAGGVTPTWSNYRYWMISLVGIGSTSVAAAAEGYGGSTPSETISLAGTSGSPDSPGTVINSNNDSARVGLLFLTNGIIQRTSGIGGVSQTNYATWCNVAPSQTYYIRCTSISTTSVVPDDGHALNTWHALSTQRNFIGLDLSETGTYGDENFVIKIEIASDSGGTNILATGYYQCEWNGLA